MIIEMCRLDTPILGLCYYYSFPASEIFDPATQAVPSRKATGPRWSPHFSLKINQDWKYSYSHPLFIKYHTNFGTFFSAIPHKGLGLSLKDAKALRDARLGRIFSAADANGIGDYEGMQ